MLLIGVLAGLLRLGFALLPLAQHLLVLEDDAWMVTAIARNWATGRGVTADGVFPTNGFHPLYTLTLGALPYLVAPNNLAGGFTASLVICALLATAVIWPLYLLTRHLAGPTAALIAVALYGLNPFMIRLTVNGMETSMALLLFTVSAAGGVPSRSRAVVDQSLAGAADCADDPDAVGCSAAVCGDRRGTFAVELARRATAA